MAANKQFKIIKKDLQKINKKTITKQKNKILSQIKNKIIVNQNNNNNNQIHKYMKLLEQILMV